MEDQAEYDLSDFFWHGHNSADCHKDDGYCPVPCHYTPAEYRAYVEGWLSAQS